MKNNYSIINRKFKAQNLNFQLKVETLFFFYQSTIITFLQTKTNNEKLKKICKETVDKTLHYLIAICNIQAVRDYKKYRYFIPDIIDVFVLLDLLDLLLIFGMN